MITLYTFGPSMGMPDPSSFVMKAMVLLKMSGQDFVTDTTGLRKAPKGKLPYMRDSDGTIVADSTFIRWHLEQRYGVDFDSGLDNAQKAVAWAFEKMCEEHAYWSLVHTRWIDEENFQRGPARFFDAIPMPLRPLIRSKIRRDIAKSLYGHGMGRHTKAEIERLAGKDIEALAAQLGEKPWLMGGAPTGVDASAFPIVAGLLQKEYETPLRAAAESHANLVAYRNRGMQRWFPEFA